MSGDEPKSTQPLYPSKHNESPPLTANQLLMLQNYERHAENLSPQEKALMQRLQSQHWSAQTAKARAVAKSEGSSSSRDTTESPKTSSDTHADNIRKEPVSTAARPSNVEGEAVLQRRQAVVKLETLKTSQRVYFHIGMNSKEILETCKNNAGPPSAWSVLGDGMDPPQPPGMPTLHLSADQLVPPTPVVHVESKHEAFSSRLQLFCLNHPIAVVRGLTAALEIDLSLFSTETLVEASPDHEVEVRTQRIQSVDENWDSSGSHRIWAFISNRSYTTLRKYAHYQSSSLQESLRDKCGRSSALSHGASALSDSDSSSSSHPIKSGRQARMLRFGTNVDLSDEQKWKPQLTELQKLPPFVSVDSTTNILSFVGHVILGMNTVQLYMKVPGSRTPGYQENNNFCSININIGPGDCEWFAVPNSYWGGVRELCDRHELSYLEGTWWPDLEELRAHGMPVYRFMQRPGELVFVNAGCVHWVQATGWCNNIAWNVGPLTADQYSLALERYEWNKLQKFKSIVPMVHLTWNLARNIRVLDPHLHCAMRTCLMQSLRAAAGTLAMARRFDVPVYFHGRVPGETSHYCGVCEREVWHALLVREHKRRPVVHCLMCARCTSPLLMGFICLEEYHMDELALIYDAFTLRLS